MPRASGSSHRAPDKQPLLRGGTAVGATAALGAVVTGSLLAVSPGSHQKIADVAEQNFTPLDLASASEALAMQPPSAQRLPHGSSADVESSSATTTLLPVATPSDRGDRFAASDQRDVEMLHKAEKLASEAAAAHAAASKEAFLVSGGGGLNDWISLALRKMNMSQALAPGLRAIIMRESRGNPRAINRTDSNALAGRPSQGLMQTIPSTFRNYVLPEYANLPITNPVANITAGVRYMLANYGLSTLMGGGRFDGAGHYLGY